MALSLEALRAMDAIDRRGSFAAAAEELDRVPSALTYLIRKLEGDLDVLLFDRRGHRAKLTAVGAELLRGARELLASSDELERQVRRVATGWEVELRIAVDGILRRSVVFDLLARFYAVQTHTRIRLTTEVLSGTWDALASGRVDLALGVVANAPGAAETVTGFHVRPLGFLERVFAVAPTHPLAGASEPVPMDEIRRHRAVAVGDTSRNLPRTTLGILQGQDVLTVASTEDKVAAQIAGLGCGYLPVGYAAEHIAAGRLVAKLTTEPRMESGLFYAWNVSARGKAIGWFLEQLEQRAVRDALVP